MMGPSHSFTLDTSRCLWLRTVDDIDEFEADYLEPNWAPTAAQYAGVIIAPYQWERRLDGDASDWYYGWDCASGCIWNADAIASIAVLSPVVSA